MLTKDLFDLALATATKSPARKRKVGCVITINGEVAATGYNYNPNGAACEDDNGVTLPSVFHAERAAIYNFHTSGSSLADNDVTDLKFYITHAPCDNCRALMQQFRQDIQAVNFEIVIVSEGMKFDSGKIDYTLIPQIAIEGLAKVLHYGARKYKPNNWRQVDPSKYVAAFERHWRAYTGGELVDPETNLPHLCHAMTNLSFLLELNYVPERQQTIDDYIKNLHVAN